MQESRRLRLPPEASNVESITRSWYTNNWRAAISGLLPDRAHEQAESCWCASKPWWLALWGCRSRVNPQSWAFDRPVDPAG